MAITAQPFYARELTESFAYLNIVIYSAFGIGKTHLAGTSVLVPEMRDVLYINLEGGEKGLKEVVRQAKKNNLDINKHVLTIPVETYLQFANVYEFLKLHIAFRDANDEINLRRLEAQIKGIIKGVKMTPDIIANNDKLKELIPEPKKFKTVIIDSLSEAQKYCMYQILGIDPKKVKISDEPEQAGFSDWGKSREMIQFLVRRYRDLPVHTIFACGRDDEQDSRKRYVYKPLLPGQLSKDIQGLVDVVGYYEKITLEQRSIRRLYLEGGSYQNFDIAAKHRFGSNLKGFWVDDPTMQTLYDLDNK